MRKLAVILGMMALAAFATADVLWDNGPLVTHPGQGYGGADASAVMTSLLESIYGYGAQLSANNRVADDFTVPSPGWNLDTVSLPTYQTNSTSPTITGLTLRIWSGDNPNNGTLVWGDTSTNRMQSQVFANVYRVLDTGLTNNARHIVTVTGNVGVTLPAGHYWLDWQFNGSGSSGPWAPPVSFINMTNPPGANGMQSLAGAAFAALQDSGSMTPDDLVFTLVGTPVPEPTTLALFGLLALIRRR